MRRTLVAAALFGLIVPQAASAQGGGVWAVCQVRSICAGVQPGGGRIVECLRQHKDQLSEACYAAIGRQMVNRQPRAAAGGMMKAAPAGNAAAAPPAPAASGAPATTGGAGGGMDLDAAPPADDLGGQEPAPQ